MVSSSTVPPPFELRRYGPADEAPVLDLLRTCLPHWRSPTARDRFRWKHEHGPFGRSRPWVAVEGSRVIAFAASMPWRLRLGERELLAGWDMDLAVSPDRQRRGVGTALVVRGLGAPDRAREDLHLNHGNTGSGATVSKAGFAPGHRITVHYAPLRPVRLLRSRRRPRARPVDDRRLPPVEQALEDEDAVEELIARSVPHDRLVTARSVAYLRWRYVEVPGERYVATTLRAGDGRLRGLLIGRGVPSADPGTLEHFEVSEVVVPELDPAALRALLRRVWCLRAAYAAVRMPLWLQRPREALMAGFPIAREREWTFRARALTDGLPDDLGDPRHWVLPLGDLTAL